MLDLAGVTVGSQVLDLGAGTGDQTMLAARRAGPGGMVLATDISASMLALTQRAARDADLANVQTRVMDAQRLELEADSFDAAMARFSLQFVPDVPRALAEVRRVLKPGGRFAAAVFSAIERNSFRASPQAIASRLAGKPFPAPGPGQWALTIRARCGMRWSPAFGTWTSGESPSSTGSIRGVLPAGSPGGGTTSAREAPG